MAEISQENSTVPLYTDRKNNGAIEPITCGLAESGLTCQSCFLDTTGASIQYEQHPIIIAAIGIPGAEGYEKSITALLDQWKESSHKPALIIVSSSPELTTPIVNDWKNKNPHSGTDLIHVKSVRAFTNTNEREALLKTCRTQYNNTPSTTVQEPHIRGTARKPELTGV